MRRGFGLGLSRQRGGFVFPALSFAAEAIAEADNAQIIPVNPAHIYGDTLLLPVVTRWGAATVATATLGWAPAEGAPGPISLGNDNLWFFENRCDSNAESNPTITVSNGGAGGTVFGAVIRIRGRDWSKPFAAGAASINSSGTGAIAFTQNSPVVLDGSGLLAIAVRDNDYSTGNFSVISGVTAGLTWSELVDYSSAIGFDQSMAIDTAVNNTGANYQPGTGGSIGGASFSVGAPSAGVYLMVPH